MTGSEMPSGASNAQAGKPRQVTWMMVGAVASGKTFFVDLVKMNRSIEREIRHVEESPYSNFDFVSISDDGYVIRALESLAKEGRPPATSGKKREHHFDVTATLKADGASGDSAAQTTGILTAVRLVDAAGGAILPSVDPRQLTEEVRHAHEEYNATAREAEALLICLPARRRVEHVEAVHGFHLQQILTEIYSGKYPNLKRIAICLTKYEAVFHSHGKLAESKALDPREIIGVWKSIDPKEALLENLEDLQHRKALSLQIAVFPVSAYGFIGETGYANLLSSSDGQMEIDGELPVLLQHRPSTEVGPFRVPLFPAAFPASVVDENWKPFNLLAPLIFLAGGSPAGLLHLSLAELASRVAQHEMGAQA